MSLIVRRKTLGLCFGLLFCVWNESALAWQFGGGGGGSGKVDRNQRRDATVPLEKRLAQEKEGRELFVRDWSRSDSKPAPGGDGLGPMYNAVSCVACHELWGIGGAGDVGKNVRLLHLIGANGVPLRTATTGEAIEKSRQQVHPDFMAATSLVLHRHQIESGAESLEYQHWLGRRLPGHFVDRQTQLPLKPEAQVAFVNNARRSPLESASNSYRVEGLPVRLTERNTPALFGAGLIDSIPDAAIVEQAERQKKYHAPFITGRVPQNAHGAIGRFGWRGQVNTLHEFVLTACSVELGLSVPGHAQARPVLARREFLVQEAKQRNAQPNDLTQEQCVSLTAYVASLSEPQSARAGSLNQAKSAQRGTALFEKIGCSICHAPDVGSVVGLYSDLLLHDMGPNLADPLPANPEINEQTVPGGGGGAYSGSFSQIELVKHITTKIHQEWRTPPLWGVASSAPYLHDGRAATLEQAIQWHGGEGQRAAEAFRALKLDERGDLVQFLESLAAPGDGPVIRPRRNFGGGGAGGGGGGGGGGFF